MGHIGQPGANPYQYQPIETPNENGLKIQPTGFFTDKYMKKENHKERIESFNFIWDRLHFYHLKENKRWYEVILKEYDNMMNQDAAWSKSEVTQFSDRDSFGPGEVRVESLWK